MKFMVNVLPRLHPWHERSLCFVDFTSTWDDPIGTENPQILLNSPHFLFPISGIQKIAHIFFYYKDNRYIK